jgi:hypothetical protein
VLRKLLQESVNDRQSGEEKVHVLLTEKVKWAKRAVCCRDECVSCQRRRRILSMHAR